MVALSIGSLRQSDNMTEDFTEPVGMQLGCLEHEPKEKCIKVFYEDETPRLTQRGNEMIARTFGKFQNIPFDATHDLEVIVVMVKKKRRR